MARKKTAAAAPEPEDISQDTEEQEAMEATPPDDEDEPAPAPRLGRPPKAARAPAKAETISKTEAVRLALAAGHEAPQEGTAYIREEFGIEIAPQHFSTTKSKLKSQDGVKKANASKAKSDRKPKAAPSQAVEGYLAPPPKPASAGGTDLLDALEAMKPLVASLGKDQVHRIIELLG